MGLTVVIGPPAAGKSTWVHDHAEPGDIIIDLDQLALALSPHEPGEKRQHTHTPEVTAVAKAARRAAIDTALRHTASVDVYLIQSTPGQRTLANYRRHGARIVTVDPGREVVLERCKRLRSRTMIEVAESWYQQQPSPPRKPSPQPGKTTTQRGYGYRHRRLRDTIRPHVEAGEVSCWRCHQPIHPDQPWDLGHDDTDRSVYRGPEHTACNRGSAARRGNQARANRHSRQWLT